MYAMDERPESDCGGENEDQIDKMLLWMRPQRASRGRQPTYSRDQIADAGIKLADLEGLEAASMRRVAAEIGTRATSLYRYVRSKEELLDLMVDRVTGERGVPKPTGRWREDLRTIGHHMRAMVKAHPWMISIPIFRSALGPNSLALFEATLEALDNHGLSTDEMLVIATALSTFTRGYASAEFAEQQTEAQSGLSREQWMASQTQYAEVLRKTGKYPLFMRMADEARLPHDPQLMQQGFEQSLECLLNGIAVKLS